MAQDTASTRVFDLGDVLSITTGLLVSPRHIEGVYDILDFMEGWSHFTHQLPDAARRCGPQLLAQHPQLTQVDGSNVDRDNWSGWLEEQYLAYGHTLSVRREVSPPSDPIEDLCDLVGPERVFVVRAPKEADDA